MSFPIQAPPVRRPTLVIPHTTVGIQGDSPRDEVRRRALLWYGANYNDPAAFSMSTYQELRVSAAPKA
ncbi:cyanobactin biosynthesis system PatB/AcyB/McaB family protein [Nonomuraea rhizosphaerae]|uniref:cyanobactin biosynthesis system PatB/AcyB/McaB family protein n=1 Tax=Nonomuraea rhizosphaerae TaxID=2665663 RepID=UPI001C5FA391|nr:cyanobactin biosynthesis system PatB/AcyB/McaB family protein [Nonomuraea rhizosphaerae]